MKVVESVELWLHEGCRGVWGYNCMKGVDGCGVMAAGRV